MRAPTGRTLPEHVEPLNRARTRRGGDGDGNEDGGRRANGAARRHPGSRAPSSAHVTTWYANIP
ncbi:hypothetical protein GCM10010393_45410 [Streptomyces gobitricini]|uniref:Uncharacterized protein n=1 Tax=Streptomyces gobitricini TaxID=68211 RepID=A0ABN3MT85_9ACTN